VQMKESVINEMLSKSSQIANSRPNLCKL